jgi:ADP-ribose pyrophosphatase YjhB (NUDIX family)
MPISAFYQAIRDRVGHTLLLMPAVAALVRDQDGRILLQQQHDGSWSLPAGALEPGETPAQAIVREVKEETGLAVKPEKLVAVLGGKSCRVRYANQDEVEYVVTVFECTSLGGALIDANEETQRLAYFRVDSFPPLGFPYPSTIFSSSAEAAYFAELDAGT